MIPQRPAVESSSAPVFCPQKKALTDLYIEATRDFMALQDAETKAIREGTIRERFDLALYAARSKRDRIKREYLLHVQEHGCYTDTSV